MWEGDLVKICALWVVQICMCERCLTNFLFMSGLQASKQTNNLKHRDGGFVISVQYLEMRVVFSLFVTKSYHKRYYIGTWREEDGYWEGELHHGV